MEINNPLNEVLSEEVSIEFDKSISSLESLAELIENKRSIPRNIYNSQIKYISSMEGISLEDKDKNIFEKIWEGIKAFFKWIWDRLTQFWNWLTGLFSSKEKKASEETKKAEAAVGDAEKAEELADAVENGEEVIKEPNESQLTGDQGLVEGDTEDEQLNGSTPEEILEASKKVDELLLGSRSNLDNDSINQAINGIVESTKMTQKQARVWLKIQLRQLSRTNDKAKNLYLTLAGKTHLAISDGIDSISRVGNKISNKISGSIHGSKAAVITEVTSITREFFKNKDKVIEHVVKNGLTNSDNWDKIGKNIITDNLTKSIKNYILSDKSKYEASETGYNEFKKELCDSLIYFTYSKYGKEFFNIDWSSVNILSSMVSLPSKSYTNSINTLANLPSIKNLANVVTDFDNFINKLFNSNNVDIKDFPKIDVVGLEFIDNKSWNEIFINDPKINSYVVKAFNISKAFENEFSGTRKKYTLNSDGEIDVRRYSFVASSSAKNPGKVLTIVVPELDNTYFNPKIENNQIVDCKLLSKTDYDIITPPPENIISNSSISLSDIKEGISLFNKYLSSRKYALSPESSLREKLKSTFKNNIDVLFKDINEIKKTLQNNKLKDQLDDLNKRVQAMLKKSYSKNNKLGGIVKFSMSLTKLIKNAIEYIYMLNSTIYSNAQVYIDTVTKWVCDPIISKAQAYRKIAGIVNKLNCSLSLKSPARQ